MPTFTILPLWLPIAVQSTLRCQVLPISQVGDTLFIRISILCPLTLIGSPSMGGCCFTRVVNLILYLNWWMMIIMNKPMLLPHPLQIIVGWWDTIQEAIGRLKLFPHLQVFIFYLMNILKLYPRCMKTLWEQ